MDNRTVQNKPTAAFVLSLVGGILAIVVAAVFLIIGIAAGIAVSSYTSRPFGYYDYSDAYLFGGLGVWLLVCSVIVIVSAVKLNSNPLEHTKWGVAILVFSIIGGGILGIIGGVLALTFKPRAVRYLPPPPLSTATRSCPQCGRAVEENAQFCMNCGKQLF